MRVRMTIAAMTALAAAGCSQVVEVSVADHLEQAGVPAGMAQCMAGIWTERLSAQQLLRLGQTAADMAAAQQQGEPIVQILNRARALDDPQIVEVVVQSATSCVTLI